MAPETDPTRPVIVDFVARAASEICQPLPAPKDAFQFAEGAPDAVVDRLLGLVLSGAKTATTTWPVPSPQHYTVGDVAVVLDSAGEPAAVIRTTALDECRFDDVPVEHALAEGEGEFDEWRREHLAYFGRQESGDRFNGGSSVLCERFELIYPAKKSS